MSYRPADRSHIIYTKSSPHAKLRTDIFGLSNLDFLLPKNKKSSLINYQDLFKTHLWHDLEGIFVWKQFGSYL